MKDTEVGPCTFSADRLYRYTLSREWAAGEKVAWIGLNPSTADENQLDPTLRRVTAFTKGWGFTGFHMLNLFAFRATKPENMKAAADPVGPNNDQWIIDTVRKSALVICCWGTHGSFKERDFDVIDKLSDAGQWGKLHSLKVNADGSPGHPLYIKGDVQPVEYRYQGAAE